MSHLLVIDIGSSQIIAAVAEITDDRRIVVRGLGRARSWWFEARRGDSD